MNATQNRYTQQTYRVSPYIKGVFGSSNVSYQLRDDNIGRSPASFGDSSTNVPEHLLNSLSASMSSPVDPWGWTLSYSRSYYDNGSRSDATTDADSSTTFHNLLATLPYQIDPQLQVSAARRVPVLQVCGAELQEGTYGVGVQWNPTDRTQVGGFWEHSSSARRTRCRSATGCPMPRSARISRVASAPFPSSPWPFRRAPTSPSSWTPHSRPAFRIPAERAQAVEQFLARTGLPPTLASPVNFYATNLTLQETANGVAGPDRDCAIRLALQVFYMKSEAISGTGQVLPPALQFGQNNTQTGGGVLQPPAFRVR